jgi:GNAT superfamily N-acetyltransferase
MLEEDVAEARRIFSLAFGTFIGVEDPAAFGADRDYIGTRRKTRPTAAFVAEVNDEVVGSNFAIRWGTVGFFGPLTIRPDMWGQNLGKHLMTPVLDCFEQWQLTHAGLYTFPNSTKHLHLYQQYGFWPRFLTAIMSKAVGVSPATTEWSRYSEAPSMEQQAILDECFALTDSIYPGLRLGLEIQAVFDQALGDTVLIRDGGELVGMAVCHCGPATEAGADTCYIKFGAAKPGRNVSTHFHRLLDACELLTREQGLSRLAGGVSLARDRAFQALRRQGFRADMFGISMHRPNEPGYSHRDAWVMDDWR